MGYLRLILILTDRLSATQSWGNPFPKDTTSQLVGLVFIQLPCYCAPSNIIRKAVNTNFLKSAV